MEKGCFLRRSVGALLIFGIVASANTGIEGQRASQAGAAAPPVPAALAPTAHPVLPSDLAQFWFVPSQQAAPSFARPAASLSAALRYFADGKSATALPLFEAAARVDWPLASYATFYRGLCLLDLSRPAEARTLFSRLHASPDIVGFLAEAAIDHEAEAAAAGGDHAAAARLYDELRSRKTASPDTTLLALGRELLAAGDRARAAETFSRLYFEFPLSDQAAAAGAELDKLGDVQLPRDSAARTRLDLARADRLFSAKRYAAARDAFKSIEPAAKGDDAELVDLRVAECDHFLRRYRQARDRLAPLVEHSSRKAEAQYFWLSVTRELGNRDEYVHLARELVAAYPDSPWAEETLNNLATHYLVVDEDEKADAVFRELYEKFPTGAHAERAAWRAGWWAYAHGRPRDTVMFYEGAASAFRRSDYRPAYLYWSARSREQLGDTRGAVAVYRIVTADYLNTYYGRLASKRMTAMRGDPTVSEAAAAPSARATLLSSGASMASPAFASATQGVTPPPPNAGLIRLLLSLGLYDQARDEVLYAERAWGDTPTLGATLGWVYNKLGDYRRGIIAMKRAYPQYMTEEGARMPVEALKVIFPLDYWPLIRENAVSYSLDPFLIAALINQESAFDAQVKSSANAVGLMQVLPSTGKQYARKLHIRRYSTASLTNPEINIRLGLAFFADVIQRAGGVHFALAGYNAGEQRVREWNAERAGLELDEYIDGIPFPETQAYVKRIIGTTEDYRRLYAGEDGTGASAAATANAAPAKKTPKPPAKKKTPSKKIKK
jgi:soluble lytic murein transglycosylase